MSIPQPLPIPNHGHSLASDRFLLVGTNPRLRHIGLAHLPPMLLLWVGQAGGSADFKPRSFSKLRDWLVEPI